MHLCRCLQPELFHKNTILLTVPLSMSRYSLHPSWVLSAPEQTCRLRGRDRLGWFSQVASREVTRWSQAGT